MQDQNLPELPRRALEGGPTQVSLPAAAINVLDYWCLLLSADETWLWPRSRSVALEWMAHMALWPKDKPGMREAFRPRTRNRGRPTKSHEALVRASEQEKSMRPWRVRMELERRDHEAKKAQERLEDIRREIEADRDFAIENPGPLPLSVRKNVTEEELETLRYYLDLKKTPPGQRTPEQRAEIQGMFAGFTAEQKKAMREMEKEDVVDSEPEGS